MKSMLLVDIPTVCPLKVVRVQPPLWAAYLAKYLTADVEYLDGRIEQGAGWTDGGKWWTYGLPIPQLTETIIERQADVIGVHIGVSTEIGIAVQLVNALRQKTNPTILLGGPGVATIPREFLPPELATTQICYTVGIGKPLNIGLLSSDDCDLDILPDRDIWWPKYEETYQEIGHPHSGPPLVRPTLQIKTSDGCGGNCKFCATRSQKLVRRSLGSVKEELRNLQARGIHGIQFEDDNLLGFSLSQAVEGVKVLDAIVEAGFEAIEFSNGLTVRGMLNQPFQEWVRRALERGVQIKVLLPFESASDEMLIATQKPHRRADCDRLLEQLVPLISAGLHLECFLQVAFVIAEGSSVRLEEEATINQTIEWAKVLSGMGIKTNVWSNSSIPGTPQFGPWRTRFPNAPWESLLFSLPSLFYEDEKWREELIARMMVVNTSDRTAAFKPS